MIDDLSRALRAILTQKGLPAELAAAQIAFDRPSEKFTPQQTTVDLFLYDIREDSELRSNEPVVERNSGRVITHLPPLRIACSYLVTAWPVGGTDLALQEHLLLGQVLQVLAPYPTIPTDFLQGDLKTQSPLPPMVTALMDPQKNLSEFWTALGGNLRPSLTVTATIALEVMKPRSDAPVVTDILRLGQADADSLKRKETLPGAEEFRFRVGGRVMKGGEPVEKATVTATGAGLAGKVNARTNKEGHYILEGLKPGQFKLSIKKDGPPKEIEIVVPELNEKIPIRDDKIPTLNYNVELE